MDPTKAFEELRLFQPAKPEWSLLPVVAYAVAQGASFCKITCEGGGTYVDCDGPALGDAELNALFQAPFDNPSGALRELAIGMYALAQQPDTTGVTYESWNGSSGTRLKVEGGKVKTEKITKAPWKEAGVTNRVRQHAKKGGLLGGLFGGGKSAELPREATTVKELCRFAPVRLEINGEVVSEKVDLGRSLVNLILETDAKGAKMDLATPDTIDQVREKAGGPYQALLSLGGDFAPLGTLAVLVNGILFQKDAPGLAAMGVRAVVSAPELELSADHAQVAENDQFETLIADLEKRALQMGGVLAENVHDMNALDRVEASDYIKQFAMRLEETQDYEGAEKLYRRLLEGQEEALGEDDPELCPTIMKIAQLEENQGNLDEAVPLYHRILTIFENNRPDPQQIAGAHSHLANIYLQRQNLEKAEESASEALKMRKAHGDQYDLELGANYEMLARIYRARYQYPNRNFLEVDSLYLNALKIFEKNFGTNHLDVAVLLHDLAEHRRNSRRYREAEPLYRRALKIRTENVGERDQLVAQTLDSMGALYEEQGKSTQAGEHYAKALEIWEEVLGPDDPEFADRLNNLVVLYRVYGKFAQAEPLYLRLLNLEGREPDLDMVVDLTNLGLVYMAEKKLDQAEPRLTRALEILESLPDSELDQAWVLNHLGNLYDQQQRFDDADRVLNRALKILEDKLGPDHLDVSVSLDALVRHYVLQIKRDEAEQLARRSLAIKEKNLGVDHRDSISALGTLAEVVRSKGEEEEAYKLHREVLLRRVRVAEQTSADSGENLFAGLEGMQKSRYSTAKLEAEKLIKEAAAPAKVFSRYTEAEHLYLRALFAQEQALGPTHPDVTYILEDLAELYKKHRKFEGAEELYKRIMQLREAALGKNHPDVAQTYEKMMEIYSMQKRFAPAEPLARAWLEVATTTVGGNHPEVARVMEKLAEIYGQAGNAEKQEEFNRKAMDIRHEALGPNHPDFAISLADLLCLQKKYEEAGRLYSFVCNCLEENLGPESPELIPVYEKYAGVLRKLNREAVAVELETAAMVMRVQHGLDFGE